MDKTFLFKELLHVRINVFSTIMSPKHARLGLKMGTNLIIKFNKYTKHFRFMSKEVNPTHPGTVINKGNKV
jgi:hypothetical protein